MHAYEVPVAVIALLVALGFMFLGRWVFSRPGPRYGRKELRLLTAVATGLPKAEAMAVRATLGEAGIRTAMQRRWDGRMDVLVFYGDVERSRKLL